MRTLRVHAYRASSCTEYGCEEPRERHPERCSAILDHCGCALPPEPVCPPRLSGDAPLVDACHVCRCDPATGAVTCEDTCVPPEPPQGCDAQAAAYGDACSCDASGDICCWEPAEDEVCNCPRDASPDEAVCLCVPTLRARCFTL